MLNMDVILGLSIPCAFGFLILLVYVICGLVHEGMKLWGHRSTIVHIILMVIFASIAISCWAVCWTMGNREDLNQTIISREEISGINGDTLYFVNNNEVTTRSLENERRRSRVMLTDEDSSYIARIRLDDGQLYYYETVIFLSERDYNKVTGNDASN